MQHAKEVTQCSCFHRILMAVFACANTFRRIHIFSINTFLIEVFEVDGMYARFHRHIRCSCFSLLL